MNPEFDWLSADNLDGVEYGATILNTIHLIEKIRNINNYYNYDFFIFLKIFIQTIVLDMNRACLNPA